MCLDLREEVLCIVLCFLLFSALEGDSIGDCSVALVPTKSQAKPFRHPLGTGVVTHVKETDAR